MDREELFSRVSRIQWFHNFELVPGVMTNGWSAMHERASYFQIPQDLAGKRVLDVGCADGYFTFLAESRGASVVAIDSWPREGFFLAREARNSTAEFHHISVYDLHPNTFGLFDLVFFFGVYYHLKNPILALERIASVTRGYALIESEVLDLPGIESEGLSRFYELDGLNNDPSNWWAPNVACLLQTTRAAGFPRAELIARYENRAIVRAYKGPRTAGRKLSENFFVAIDSPVANARLEWPVSITGWALNQIKPQGGIERITIYLDSLDEPVSALGEAEYGIPRPDLAPSVSPIYGNMGFRFTWKTASVAPGRHTLYVMAEDETSWNYNVVSVIVGAENCPDSPAVTLAHNASEERREPSAHGRAFADLNQRLVERDKEIARLKDLTAAYERDRFIRATRKVHEIWRSLPGRPTVTALLDRLRVERFYKRLMQEVGGASSHAFVDRAYWRILHRAPDLAGFEIYCELLARGEISRRQVVARLVGSIEFRTQPRPSYGFDAVLHLTRCQLVRQLPAAKDVLDLGGAALNSVQGALFVMGYPHQVHSLTIVDLPPANRLGHYYHGDSEKPGNWIETEMGPIRYFHASMTNLSAIADNSLDLVFAGQSIEHVSEGDGRQVMREVLRVLRPGGHFCLDTPNGALTRIRSPQAFIHPEHQVEYRVNDLVTRLGEAGFVVVETQGICPMPRTVQTGVFDEREVLTNARLSDDAQVCFLFYVKCAKPG